MCQLQMLRVECLRAVSKRQLTSSNRRSDIYACRYVSWENGAREWVGLPRGLHNQLQGSHKARPGVEAISCGDAGEWFVRYLDGYWRTGNLSDSLNDTLNDVKSHSDVLSVEFGSQGDYALLYG